MEKQGKYIYGIIAANSENSFDRCWIMVNERICAIAYRDIAAIISDSEVVDYAHLRKDILAKQLVKHQMIIEGIMPQYAVIPMRLGTFAIDEAEVKGILSKGYGLIKEIISKISDKIEIDITATWGDLTSIIKEAGEEKEIEEFKEELLSNPKGIAMDEQMKIGFMLKKALDERRDKFAKEIQDSLKTFCVDFKTHELMDDKMVVNTAFLVDKDKQEGFDKKVEELNVKFNEKLNFRCVGPLPPYSFYTLEIKKLEFGEIDWAKKKLGILDGITNRDEFKKAYQRQAFSTHPDKNPDNPCAEKEFDEVNKAYKLIIDYCVALEQANQQDKSPFDRKMFSPPQRDPAIKKDKEAEKENVMLVRVRE